MSKFYSYKTQFKSVNNKEYGESIEQKIRKVLTSGEPIEETAPMIYTDRKDGVLPEHDIRTDRFDIALDAMDKVTKSIQAKRDNLIKNETPKNEE